MKRQFSALSVLLLGLTALATQSCDFADDQNSSYNHGYSDYYRDGRYAEENGYYHERRYSPDDFQSGAPPGIDVHLRPGEVQ